MDTFPELLGELLLMGGDWNMDAIFPYGSHERYYSMGTINDIPCVSSMDGNVTVGILLDILDNPLIDGESSKFWEMESSFYIT